MRAFVVLAVISCAIAAPANEGIRYLQRSKKSPSLAQSPYGCSGGPPLAPVALYLSPGPSQHYREDEAEHLQHQAEFFEPHHHHFEHHHPEQARSYYEPAPAASIAGLAAAIPPAGPILSPAPALAPATSAVFPGAKVSKCAVPLLLSCAPNVVAGVMSHGYASHGYAAPAYKAQEHEFKKDTMEKAAAASEQSFQISSFSQQPQMKSWVGDEPNKAKVNEKSPQMEAKSWAKESAASPESLPASGTSQPKSIINANVELSSNL